MALTPEQTARLAALDARLAAGVSSATFRDRSTSYDLDAIRRERDELRQLQAAGTAGSRFRRVTFCG
jgi:hypothetical protein